MTSTDLSFPSEFPLTFDVLVVGTGAAGLYTALCLPEHLSIGLVSKDVLPMSASDWAQGGIAAAISTDDSPSLHLEDTLKAGAGLCETVGGGVSGESRPRMYSAFSRIRSSF